MKMYELCYGFLFLQLLKQIMILLVQSSVSKKYGGAVLRRVA